MENKLSSKACEDAPILNLLNKPIGECTTEELRERVIKLRDVASSSHAANKSLEVGQKPKKPTKAQKAQQEFKNLENMYGI